MTDKVDELDKVIKKLANDWFKARNDGKTLKQFEKELADYITQQQHLLLDRVLEEVEAIEWKNFYSKAVSTEQAIPQLKRNYKSQVSEAIQTIKEGLK